MLLERSSGVSVVRRHCGRESGTTQLLYVRGRATPSVTNSTGQEVEFRRSENAPEKTLQPHHLDSLCSFLSQTNLFQSYPIYKGFHLILSLSLSLSLFLSPLSLSLSHTHTHTYTHTHTHTHIHTYTHTLPSKGSILSVYGCLCGCACVNICIVVCVCTYMYFCVCVCTHMHINSIHPYIHEHE